MELGKKVYASPRLTVYGDVEEITQGFSIGDHLDAAFPAGTKIGSLTFS